MVITCPIIGDVKINAPIGFVPVVVKAAAHVTNVRQKVAARAILGKMNIVLTLSGRGVGIAIVPFVMVDVMNDASYYI